MSPLLTPVLTDVEISCVRRHHRNVWLPRRRPGFTQLCCPRRLGPLLQSVSILLTLFSETLSSKRQASEKNAGGLGGRVRLGVKRRAVEDPCCMCLGQRVTALALPADVWGCSLHRSTQRKESRAVRFVQLGTNSSFSV